MKTSDRTLKFKFVRTDLNGGDHWIADNYKVIKYGDSWFAYYAVNVRKDGGFQFGSSCYHTPKNASQSYPTKEKAMAACQNHFESDKKPWDYVA